MPKVDIFKNPPKTKYKEVPPIINREELIKTIESRRSVRVFSNENVLYDDMKKCLELAVLAPNSSNLQPWEFYWIRDEIKKEKLKKYCLSR